MENKNQTPRYYARCLKADCPQADGCMRRLAALNDTAEVSEFNVINPRCLPADGAVCPHYRPIHKVGVAWGIRRLYDSVPYPVAKKLKAQLIDHFGRGRYYRFYRQEYGLYPEEQAHVSALFAQWGIAEPPVYERYSEEYRY